jgi:hypothetical protein
MGDVLRSGIAQHPITRVRQRQVPCFAPAAGNEGGSGGRGLTVAKGCDVGYVEKNQGQAAAEQTTGGY